MSPGHSRTVIVSVDREEGSSFGLLVGLRLDSERWLITEVQPGGLIDQWNQRRPQKEWVLNGDWLISVNGVTGPASSMYGQLKSIGRVDLVVSDTAPPQPEPASTLMRAGVPDEEGKRIHVALLLSQFDGIGAEVAFTEEGAVILGISEGCLQCWNRKHPDREVRVGDTIVCANKKRCFYMLTQLWQPGVMHMVVRRGRCPSGPDVVPQEVVDRLPTPAAAACCADGDPEDNVCAVCCESLVREDTDGSTAAGGPYPTEYGSEAIAKAAQVLVEAEMVATSACDTAKLPCGHVFHRRCIGRWLTQHSSLCPLCAWSADMDPSIVPVSSAGAYLDQDGTDHRLQVETV